MSSDKEIWDDFRNGDKEALDFIYRQHVQVLYKYGRSFTVDEDVIKDNIQELFYDLLRTRSRLGETDNICFYLLKSFKRRIFSDLKMKSKTQSIDLVGVTNDAILPIEDELIQFEDLHEKNDLVKKTLETLSQKQREILFFRFNAEMSYQEICEIMDIEYDSARKLLFRTLKSLRETMSGKELLAVIAYCLCV